LPSATFQKFDCFMYNLAQGKHRCDTDVFKVMLTNVIPLRTNAVKADITEIAAGHGYAAGGNVAAYVSDGQVAGLYKLFLANPAQWVASGGDIATFQWAVIYNSTASGGPLVGWAAYPAAVDVHAAETFDVELDATNGVFQLQ
jgi:hypothetical protein